MGEMVEKMAELEKKLKLKKRGKELKKILKKGAKLLGSSCKKGWKKAQKLAIVRRGCNFGNGDAKGVH